MRNVKVKNPSSDLSTELNVENVWLIINNLYVYQDPIKDRFCGISQ